MSLFVMVEENGLNAPIMLIDNDNFTIRGEIVTLQDHVGNEDLF